MAPSMYIIIMGTVLTLARCVIADYSIAAFNIKILGKTKMKNDDVVEILVKIIRRYDIIFIQEIRDKKGTAIEKLLEKVNDHGAQQYGMKVSERLGRNTRGMEQYAYMYRLEAGIKILEEYQYEDPEDKFIREPYALRVQAEHTNMDSFVLVGVHIRPKEAVQEINHLDDVHSIIAEKWQTENIVIMGDFNADCRYVRESKLAKLDLKDDKFHWLIPDDADTTVSKTDCAYDRFVMTGEEFLSSVRNGSVQVYRYDREYDLNEEEAMDVSDHYPIEFSIDTEGKNEL